MKQRKPAEAKLHYDYYIKCTIACDVVSNRKEHTQPLLMLSSWNKTNKNLTFSIMLILR